jgi:dihydroorotate dehydrogenase (fumarate)
MDLSTKYLGLALAHPIIPGASPLCDDLDTVKKLADAGAPALVMHSLFEEQVVQEQETTSSVLEDTTDRMVEARTFFPKPHEFRFGPDEYLNQIQRIKKAAGVPVIASLNGSTAAGWLGYAKQIEQAGADALELNVYFLAANPQESGPMVEQRVLDTLRTVKRAVSIPVSIKLSPFYSSVANMASQLDQLGADGIVLFNRFYQPDIDLDALEVVPSLQLSSPDELLLRLRWLAVLSGQVKASLCASGGVHSATDVVKAIMAGADCVQTVSVLLKKGPEHLAALVKGLATWMEDHEYDSVQQMRGSMSHRNCPNPSALERANYARVLQSWRANV